MKNIIMSKIKINGVSCLIPAYDSDAEEFEKLKGQVKCTITQPRNIKFHKKLFALLNIAVDNGIFDFITINIVNENQKLLSLKYINAIRIERKNDVDALLYILKFLFLPLVSVTLPDGRIEKRVNSIDFTSRDNIEFTEFYENVVYFVCDVFEINRDDFEIIKSNYM
jgi:hypothetical protein